MRHRRRGSRCWPRPGVEGLSPMARRAAVKETAQKPIVATVVAGWAHTAHWMVIAVRPPSSKGQECRV